MKTASARMRGASDGALKGNSRGVSPLHRWMLACVSVAGMGFADPSFALQAPVVSKTFSPSSVPVGTPSTMTITLTNPNMTSVISNVAFQDTYPTGMLNAIVNPLLGNSCGGTAIATPNDYRASLSGGVIPANGSCQVLVSVAGTAVGMHTNSTGVVQSSNAPPGSSAAGTLSVTGTNGDVAITQTSPASTVPPNTAFAYSAVVSNLGTSPIYGARFREGYRDNFTPTGITCTGSITGRSVCPAAGASTVANLEGAGIAVPVIFPGEAVTFKVTGAAGQIPGTYAVFHGTINPPSGVTDTNSLNDGATSSIAIGSAVPVLSLVKTANAPLFSIGGSYTYTLVVSNNGTVQTTGPVQVTDNLPNGISYISATGSDPGWSCSGGTVSLQVCTYNPDAPGAAGALEPGEQTTLKLNVGVSFLATSGDNLASVSGGGSAACSAMPPPASCSTSVFTGLTSLPALTVTKTASANPIVAGQSASFTITVRNQGGVATSGSVFVNDVLPPGLSAANMTGTGWSCDPVAVQCSRANQLLPGASYPDITLTVAVASNAASTLTNTANATGGGDTSCWTAPLAPHCIGTATVSVLGVAPSVSKTFAPSNVQSGDASKMTISLANAGSQSITGVAFDDVYPPGIQNANSSVVDQNTCGGTLVSVAGGSELTLSNGLIPVTGCSIVINVVATLTTAGTVTNHTGPVTSDNAQDGADATGTLTVVTAGSLAAPAVTKAFQPATVPLGGASLMTIALANPNNQAITGVAFNDVFPSGLINASGSAIVSNTCGGTVTAVPGGNAVGLSGGVIPASGCSVVVNVVGTAQGNLDNHVGAVTSANALASADANATLTVNAATALAAPLVSKTFAPANVAVGQHAQMTIVLTNPPANTQPISGVSFADAYPAGIANASTGTIVSDDGGCHGGIVSAPANGASTTLVGGTLPVGGSCSIVIDVVGTAPGGHTNNTGVVLSSNAPTNAVGASGTLSVSTPSGPDLTVTKSHVGDFTAGQIAAKYKITVSNSGVGPTTGTVTIVDTIIDTFELTATGFDAPGWNCTLDSSTGRLTCTRSGVGADAIAPGASYPDITLRVDVDTGAEGNTATNTVMVSGGGETNTSNDTAQDVATIGAAVPDLVITKSHTGNFSQGQSNATYTLTVSNLNTGGADTSGQVSVTDTLPAGLSPIAIGGTGWACPSLATLTCTRGDVLFAGSSYPPITVTVRVDAAPGTLTNIATVSGGNETDLANDSASDPTTIVGTTTLPAPTAAKAFSPSSVPLGGASQMTITLTNPNAQPVVGTTFTDTYPAGLANAPAGALVSNTCTGVATAADGGTAASLTGGVIPANGNCSLIVNVVATAAAPTSLDNHVGTVTSANALASADANAVLTVTGTATLAAPLVAKTFTPSNVSVGGHSHMTITLTNPSANTQAIAGASLTDAYPTGMANAASGVIVSDDNGCAGGTVTAAANGTSMTLSSGTLPPGGGCAIVIDVVATASGDHVNSTGPVASSNAPANTVGASATLSVAGTPTGPDLAITKAHVGNFSQGQSDAQYTITVSNVGNLPTSGGVTVTDALPLGLNVQSIGGQGWGCSLTPGIPCTRSNPLDPGMSYPPITLTVSVTANAPPSLTNHATVAGGGETNTANDTASDPTTIVPGTVDLSISKTHAGSFSQGGAGTYTISVSNVGALPTNGSTVSVSDTLPAGLTATAIGGGGTWSCTLATLICTRNDVLAPAQSYPPITLTVDVAANAPATVTNTASLTGGGDTNAANNTASDPTTITVASSGPDLAIVKTHLGNFSRGESNAQYTITVSNAGGAATSGDVTVTDTLPTGLSATSIMGSGWQCAVSPALACVRADALAPGESYPDITLTVDVAATAGASITNVATVANANDSNPSNNTAGDPTTIDPAQPDLAIAKSHAGNFIAGQAGARYTIDVVNDGALPTSGAVTVSDTLPAGMTATAIGGSGWSCGPVTQTPLTCGRLTVLPPASHYSPITVTVDVLPTATGTLTNRATVSGGGESNSANDTADDPTVIDSPTTPPTQLLAVDDAFYVNAADVFDTTTPSTGDTLHNGYRSVLANDQPQGLVAMLVAPPSHGSVALADDGTIVYHNTDAPTTSGSDVFTYRACESASPATCSAAATVFVTVLPQGQTPPPPANPPVAVDDAAIVAPGGLLDTGANPPAGTFIGGHASVLDNDAGQGLQATVLSAPAHIANPADFSLAANGTLHYKNGNDGAPRDTFGYEACDSAHTCAGAIVTLSIGNGLTDHAPIAVDDLLQVAPGVTLDTTPLGGDTLIGGAASVLSNDTDEDAASGDTLVAKLLTYPSFSTVPPFALNADGTLVYESDVAANDSFVYESCDSFGACAPAIVSAWVTTAPPDHLPVAIGDQIQVAAGGTANTLSDGHHSLLDNDQDTDPGEQATLTAHHLAGSGPAHGTATVNADGSFSYTHDGSTFTTDSFDYEACDIHGGCSRATVSIGVGTGSVPTVACRLPTQTYVVGASGAAVDIDLTPLFTPPAGDTLVYSFAGLPTPPFSIDPGNHLVAQLLAGDIGVYEATLTATTSQPPPLSASEDVTFVVLSASEVLLRDGFDGGLVPQPCP